MASIILEGADGTGKTTLATMLSKYYGWDICHCTSEDPTDYDFYSQISRKQNVIWDRHAIGELIYPTVFNRKAKIGAEDVRLILHHAKESGAKIFVLTADIKDIEYRLNKRGNEVIEVLDKINWINDQFVFYAEQFNVPLINTSLLNKSEMLDLITLS